MLEKIIYILKNETNYVSGEVIGKELGISRAGVWKNIVKLKGMGYNISSVANKGYFLEEKFDTFNKIEIKQSLKCKDFIKECYFFEEIDSTNDFAKKLAAKNLQEGDIIVANYQNKGKGRFNRDWISEKGEGLYFSLILTPYIDINKVTHITFLIGIALCNTINKLGLNAKIKWPNDIILNGKKVSGILTELTAQVENIEYIIAGIGVNVNNIIFNEEIKNKATSLYLESGKFFERREIISDILFEFEKIYKIYLTTKEFNLFYEEYKKLCLNIGQNVKIILNGKEITGKATDIGNFGELVILKENGEETIVVSGDVSLRNENGNYI